MKNTTVPACISYTENMRGTRTRDEIIRNIYRLNAEAKLKYTIKKAVWIPPLNGKIRPNGGCRISNPYRLPPLVLRKK